MHHGELNFLFGESVRWLWLWPNVDKTTRRSRTLQQADYCETDSDCGSIPQGVDMDILEAMLVKDLTISLSPPLCRGAPARHGEVRVLSFVWRWRTKLDATTTTIIWRERDPVQWH